MYYFFQICYLKINIFCVFYDKNIIIFIKIVVIKNGVFGFIIFNFVLFVKKQLIVFIEPLLFLIQNY